MHSSKNNKIQKELIAYILWGSFSTLLNIGLFQILTCLKTDYYISNIIALTVTKIFCYVTNKLFVFHSKCSNILELLKEMRDFFGGRLFTFFLDYLGVIALVELMGIDTLCSKSIMAVIVIIINYIFSRKIVFRKTDG